jgi:seryl-tRNA synthetase
MPGRNDYGEVTSTSNTTDYQARRLRIRYRRAEPGGRPQLLHTLNGTALAISRALIALLEIYQQEDGSVVLPKVLVPYVGRERIERRPLR